MELIDGLVSIVVPVYKVEAYVERTILSVKRQTYTDWELVMVDDCSPDNSSEVIKKYIQSDSRIKYFKQSKNYGAAAARNRGLAEARGQYIAFLDADDMWDPEKLEYQLKLMKENNSYFSYGAMRRVDIHDKTIKDLIPVPEKVTYDILLKRTYIATSTVLIDRKNIGDFRIPRIDKILGGEDYEAWLILLKRIQFAVGVTIPMVSYRDTPGSLSANKVKGLKKIYVIQTRMEKINFVRALYNTFCFGVYAFKKHYM